MNESGFFSTASGSFHSASRPPSRAWSESTERPESAHSNALVGGTRSISHEIDHIKKLVIRAESNRQHASGSITAVVFRNKKQEPVGREQIFHELDGLKRRIKLELSQAVDRAKEQQANVLARRASQIDPGQESESEVESVLDERDEELEKAHEALQVQRGQFESLLESAEERVDLLTGRNEGLLLEYKHLEAELKQEKAGHASALQSAEERLDRLTEQKEIAEARTNRVVEERDLLKRELEDLATETGKLEAQVVREKERVKGELGDTKVQLTRATKEKSALESELQATRKWVEELNTKIEDGAKALVAKSKAFDDLRVEKGSTDVAHRSAQEEILRLHALNSAVESALKESNVKVAKLEREHQDVADRLEMVKLEHGHQTRNHERSVRELHSKHETATKHAVELGRKHKAAEQTIGELKSTHAAELDRIQAEEANKIKEVEAQHSHEKAELQAAHGEELASVKADAAAKLAQEEQRRADDIEKLKSDHRAAIDNLRQEHATSLAVLEEGQQAALQKVRCEHVEKLDAANTEAREVARVTAEQHARELQNHEAELQALREEQQAAIDGLESAHSQAVQAAEKERQAAEKRHQEALEKLEAQVTKLEKCNSAMGVTHENQIKDLKTAHGVALRAVQSRYAGKIDELQQDHQEKMDTALEKWQREASESDSNFESKIEALQATHTSRCAALVAELEKLKQEAEAKDVEHTGAIAELQTKHTLACEREVADHKKNLEHEQELTAKASEELAAARIEHTDAIKKLRAEHDATVAAQNSAHDDVLTGLRDTHSSELSSLRSTVAQLQADMASLEGEHERVRRNMREEHQSSIERTTLEHAQVYERLAAEHEQELRDLEAKHNEEMASIRGELECTISESKGAAAGYEDAATKLHAEHTEELALLRSRHDAESQIANEALEDLKGKLAEGLAQQEKLVADKESEVRRARLEHDAVVESLKAEHEGQLASLRDLGGKTEHEREQEHQAELMQARGTAKVELDKARAEHAIALAAVEFAQRESVYQMQATHDQQLKILSEQHQKRLDDLRMTMTQRQAKREDDFEASKKAAAEELDRVRQEHARMLEAARSEGESMLEAKLAEAAAKTDVLTSRHDRSLSDAQHELDHIRREHEQALASVKRTLEGELDATKTMHQRSIDELKGQLQSQLDEAKVSHTREVAEHDQAWMAKMNELKEEHAKSLAELMSNSDMTTASKLKEVEQLHTDKTAMAIEDARREAQNRAATVEAEHKAALEAAVQKARSSSHAEVRNLKKRHQDAMSYIRETAQTTSAFQLSELERTHRKDVEHALERAKQAAEVERKELVATHQEALNESRSRALEAQQAEVMRLTTEHQAQLANLEARLQTGNATQVSVRQAAYDAEIAALQARLDATMTGQAEAERSLASLRQQVVNADKRIADAKAESDEHVTALANEKDDLTSQLVQVQTSLRELQQKTSGGSSNRRASTVAIREENSSLHAQVSVLEAERSTMRSLLDKRQEEKNEVSRQNDFLVKELEMLLQQRARPRDGSRSSADAIVQTDANILEWKAHAATFAPIQAARRNMNGSRPMTPASPGVRQAREDVEMAWKSRSFEDYLDNARAELSELGSVISANEALFARKINEHVGELQRAKDQLAAEYNSRVEALAKDRDTMEQLITSEQHAQFVKERKKLVAKFGASSDDLTERSLMLTTLPVDTAVALRTAERKLVDDYNQRITKRKSQIALKHAQEFQTITQDYDRNVSVLLNKKRIRLDGDLPDEPFQFEDEYGDVADSSAQRVLERRSNIKTPRSARKESVSSQEMPRGADSWADQEAPRTPATPDQFFEVDRTRSSVRSRTSNPRNERSIPRSASRPRGYIDSPDATAHPYTRRARPGSSSSSQLPPTPQLYHSRKREAADFSASNGAISETFSETPMPRTPRGRRWNRAKPVDMSSQTPPFEPDSSFGSQQAAFADMRVVSLQAKSPSILRRLRDKISLDGHAKSDAVRPGSSSGRPMSAGSILSKSSVLGWRPSHSKRSKSRHFSSGMIYYKDPAKSPPMPGPYE